MYTKMFLAMYNTIKTSYDREIIQAIVDILEEAGYGGYVGYRMGECYDRDINTVSRRERGRFLYGYAHDILFYRFDA